MTKKLELGINKDISNEDYHGNTEYYSSSSLKTILKDPYTFYKQYILKEDVPQKVSDSLDFGSYLHCAILEPHLLEKEFAVFPKHVRRGKDWEKFQEENIDKIIMTKSQDALCQELLKSFNETSVKIGKHGENKDIPIANFYRNGNPEETLCVEIQGVKIKVRADYRKEFEDFGSINDLKTTEWDVHTPELARKCADFWDYDLSAALYVMAFEQETGKPHDFYFNFGHKKTKQWHMYRASAEMLESGRAKVQKALDLIKKGLETGIWYDNTIKEI